MILHLLNSIDRFKFVCLLKKKNNREREGRCTLFQTNTGVVDTPIL